MVFQDPTKRGGLLQWLRSVNLSVDVVCLQETHCVSEEECRSWFLHSGFNFAVSPGSNHSCGRIVLFRPVLNLVSFSCHVPGRTILCNFSFHDLSFCVLCLYAPNRNPARDLFFNELCDVVDPSIVCSDFNTVFDRSLDRRGSSIDDSSRESTTALVRLFDSCCVIDVWRYLHPTSTSFTWTRPNGLFASRIDMFGCPYPWVSSVTACDIIPCPFSDHCAVCLNANIPAVVPPGPGLWKLNVSILSDDEYVRLVTDFWVSWRRRQNSFSS